MSPFSRSGRFTEFTLTGTFCKMFLCFPRPVSSLFMSRGVPCLVGGRGERGGGRGGSVFRVPVFLALILHAPAEVHCRMFLRHGLYIGFS